MKKIFLMLAAAGMLFSACQKDENLGGTTAGEALVTVNATVPQAVAVRAAAAYSDSAKGGVVNADDAKYDLRFILKVYEGETVVKEDQWIDEVNALSHQRQYRLVPGHNYTFVVWADIVEEDTEADLFYNTSAFPQITEADGKHAINEEARDAYFVTETIAIEENANVNLTLKRPFGKVRVVTTDWAEDAVQNGGAPTSVTITYNDVDVYAGINIKDGSLLTKTTATNAYTAEINNYSADAEGEKTLYVDYIWGLPATEGASAATVEQYPIHFTIATAIRTYEVKADVPVTRNWLTTVKGNILTTNTNININVDPNFGNEHTTTSLQALQLAAVNGGDVTLTEDVVLTEPLVVAANMSINLNGYTISYASDVAASSAMITVNNGKKLVVDDTKATGKISYQYTGAGDPNFGWGTYTIANNGTLVIENGTIEMLCDLNGNGSAVHMYCAIHQGWGASSTTINNGKVSTPTYRSIRVNQGTLTINNGTMEGQVWMQPSSDNVAITINGGSFAPRGVDGSSVFVTNDSKDVVLKVTAGTFETKIGCSDFTKSGVKGSVSGGVYGAEVNQNLVAEGYKAIENNGKWYVFTADVDTLVGTAEELAAAMNAGTSIKIIGNITVNSEWNFKTQSNYTKAVTIDGQNHTIKFTNKVYNPNNNNAFFFEAPVVLKNLTIDMSEAIATNNRLRAISTKSSLTVDNCTFIGNASYTNTRGIIFAEGTNNLTDLSNIEVSITNSTFSNWKRGVTDNENGKDVKTVTIEGCKFTNASVYVSAFDTITFVKNVLNGSLANITSYTSAATAKVKAVNNTLDASQYNVIGSTSKLFDSANVEAQAEFTVNTL